MQIDKFKKDKNNLYKIYFTNGDNVLLYDDVIVKYNLLVNKVLNDKLYEEIIQYNNFLDGYYKVIKYINIKLRTELEVRKYLDKLYISKKNIDKLIDKLYEDNYLNKDRYLVAYINDQYNLSNNGPLKIKKDLLNLGYDNNDIDEYLYKYDWNYRIDGIIDKKIRLNHKLSNNNLKSKIINDIIKLGYEKEVIFEKLSFIELNDDSILKKELYKIKKKYSNKYSNNELEYRVINYLYKKGFNIEDIKRYYNEDDV